MHLECMTSCSMSVDSSVKPESFDSAAYPNRHKHLHGGQRWVAVAADAPAGAGDIARYVMFVLPAGRCLHSAEAIGSDPLRLWMSF